MIASVASGGPRVTVAIMEEMTAVSDAHERTTDTPGGVPHTDSLAAEGDGGREYEHLELVLVDQQEKSHQRYDVHFEGRQLVTSQLRLRWGRNRLNEPIVHKLAYPTTAARTLLRREWDTGVVLHDRLAAGGYPAQLSHIVGYSAQSASPGLVATSRGEPLSELRPQFPLPPERFKPVVNDLVRTLRWLSVARVVHGRINLSTLQLDESGLQLTSFEHATQEGKPHSDCPCCPRQATGTRAAHRDDIYAAALVIYQLYTGEHIEFDDVNPGDMRERLALQDVPLRALLDGVFDDHAQACPDARVLLRRLQLPDPTRRGPTGMEDRELRALEQFQAVRTAQHTFRAMNQHTPPVPKRKPVVRSPGVPPGPETGENPAVRNVVIMIMLVVAVVMYLVVVTWR